MAMISGGFLASYARIMNPKSSLPPYVAVLDMLLAQWSAAAVSAVARLDIPDLLKAGPKTTAELA
jgi:hypothetical protein